MATFKGVIFANKAAFDGMQTAVFNYFKAIYNTNLATNWSNGIEAKDASGEWLMPIDDRVINFNWNPHAVVDITKGDSKWFTNDTL